jgi:hypothetical protein
LEIRANETASGEKFAGGCLLLLLPDSEQSERADSEAAKPPMRAVSERQRAGVSYGTNGSIGE